MRFSPPLQVLERGPGGEVSESPEPISFDHNKHHRRSIRLRGYDYAQEGAYFVTICTHLREEIFGEVVNGRCG